MDCLRKAWIHALQSSIHGLRKSMLCAQHIHVLELVMLCFGNYCLSKVQFGHLDCFMWGIFHAFLFGVGGGHTNYPSIVLTWIKIVHSPRWPV